MNKINYYHSLIFFNLCIFLSAFEFLRNNNLLILSLFFILTLGISHGALDHIKGKKLLKLLNYKDSLNIIRDYHKTRENIIHNIFDLIQSINNDNYKLI